jgi:hypothetical protein
VSHASKHRRDSWPPGSSVAEWVGDDPFYGMPVEVSTPGRGVLAVRLIDGDCTVLGCLPSDLRPLTRLARELIRAAFGGGK